MKNFEEEFDFKPKIRKDKYYVAAKEREAVEMCCLWREEGGERRGESRRGGKEGREGWKEDLFNFMYFRKIYESK